MKQLLILSGKGGTGKTTVASAFIKLSKAKAYADCDVDAPNLHLINGQKGKAKVSSYYGLPKASIDTDKCIKCGKCIEHCRFSAISVDSDGNYNVNHFSCEGCSVCDLVCPAGAVTMAKEEDGKLTLYDEGDSIFSTAQLKMGSGTSGMLVTEVKKQMKNAAPQDTEVAVIDGSPGIGCPVIASLSGVDMVLIVAEPSVSGISDMERIIKTARIFGTKIAVCVNKYDTNIENTENIENFSADNNLPFAGRIPFDSNAVKAINRGHTIVEEDCISGSAVKEIHEKVINLLYNK